MKREKLEADAVLFILNKYKIYIGFFDDSYLHIKKRVRINDGDTFSKWKEKVFGSHKADVRIHGVDKIAPNTQFSTIQEKYASSSIPNAINRKIRSLEKDLEQDLKEKIHVIQNEFEQRENGILLDQQRKIIAERKRVETFSVELLQECIEEQESTYGMELSVKQFFERWLNSKRRIDTREILTKLIRNYNASVSASRKALVQAQ